MISNEATSRKPGALKNRGAARNVSIDMGPKQK